MKINLCENLLRRSVENHILTYRHNRREDEILNQKFALYQRQIRLVDHNIHMAERRFEHRAKDNLGLSVSYKRKPLEASQANPFHYSSTNKNWTTKEYSVEPMQNLLEHKNVYEYAFERRSQQYRDELTQKSRHHNLRKENFMYATESFVRDDQHRNNDWPTTEHARYRPPAVQHKRANHLPGFRFPLEI